MYNWRKRTSSFLDHHLLALGVGHCYLPHYAKPPRSGVSQSTCLTMIKHKAADP